MTTTDTGTALWPITISPSDHPATAAERDAVLADPGFGRSFTDHLVRATWTAADGWHDARLEAYGPLVLDPATNFMHYGQAIFEGLKAYRHADGSIRTFRPIQNAERFANSARRLAMAELPDRAVPRLDRGAGAPGPRLGAQRPGEVPVPAAVHDLHGDRPRGASRRPLRVPAHRVAGRCLLPARAEARERVDLGRLRAGRSGRHGRGQVRRQLRRLPGRPGRGRPARLRPGRVARCGRASLDRGDGRHEPVLRARLTATPPDSSPPS